MNKHGIEELGEITRPFIIPDKPLDTLKIVSDEVESGFIIINAADFDKATMKKFAEKKASE